MIKYIALPPSPRRIELKKEKKMHQCAVVEVVVVNEVNVRPPAAILVVDKRRNMTRSLPQFFFFSLAALFQDS